MWSVQVRPVTGIFTAVLLGWCLGASVPGYAQAKRAEAPHAPRNSPAVLIGTDRIRPRVEFAPSLSTAGLAPETIETDLKKWLRAAGIKISESSDDSVPNLEVNIDSVGVDASGRNIVTIGVEVNEDVQLMRTPRTRVFGAATWIRRKSIAVPKGKAEDLRAAVKDLVDKFCADYQKTNRKK